MKFLRFIIVGAVILFFGKASLYAQDTRQHIVPNRVNSTEQQKKPYLILISADGFRNDLADKYHAENLIALRNSGVQAKYLRPCYPTFTFPNHYSIATGLYPAHHGIVNNSFYDEHKKAFYSLRNRKAVEDGSWYGGVPLWAVAEKNKMLSASFYWVGSEAAVDGIRPTYYYNYNEKTGVDARITALKKWLLLPADKRPHLITFYFPEVDHAAHAYGVDSKETKTAVQFIDESIAKMTAMVESLHLQVNFIFVSDHGMANADTLQFVKMPTTIDTTKFIIQRGDILIHLYAKNKADISPAYHKIKAEAKDFDVYLADSTPARWHYNKKEDIYNRIGDMLLVPHYPLTFKLNNMKPVQGKHGFDNHMKEMQATFYAWGPAFKEHLTIDGFENVHIYPLVAKLLELKYSNKIDGDPKVLEGILK